MSGLWEGGLSFPNPLPYEEEWCSPAVNTASRDSSLRDLKYASSQTLDFPLFQKLEKANANLYKSHLHGSRFEQFKRDSDCGYQEQNPRAALEILTLQPTPCKGLVALTGTAAALLVRLREPGFINKAYLLQCVSNPYKQAPGSHRDARGAAKHLGNYLFFSFSLVTCS